MSLADAGIVRMAEVHERHAVLTHNADFTNYRMHGSQKLTLLQPGTSQGVSGVTGYAPAFLRARRPSAWLRPKRSSGPVGTKVHAKRIPSAVETA